MSPWVVIYRSMWGLLLTLVVIGLICVFTPKCQSIRELQRKKATIQEENRRIDQATQELRLKRERFESEPAFVERVAREAGMVRMDEVMFQVTNEPEHRSRQDGL